MFYKNIKFLVLLALSFHAVGCKSVSIDRNELTDLVFPGVVAIDKDDGNGEGVLITISQKEIEKQQSESKGSKSNGEDGSSETDNIQSSGISVFDAERNLTSYSHKDIFWGQNEYLIIGEEAARDGIGKFLDFFISNHETRLSTVVLITQGGTGNELLTQFGNTDRQITDNIRNLFNNDGPLSYVKEISLLELAQCLGCKLTEAVVPAVRLVEDPTNQKDQQENSKNDSNSEAGGESQSSSQNKKLLQMDSFAVFKGFKLIGYLSENEARAINWLSNDIRSGVIIVKDFEDKPLSLEVTQSKVKIKPKIKDNVPSIEIKLQFASNIAELKSKRNVFTEKELTYLEGQQTKIVKDQILAALDYSKKNNVDIFKFAKRLYQFKPVKWEKIKDNWEEIYPTLKIDVNVSSKINRTYLIEKPIGAESAGG